MIEAQDKARAEKIQQLNAEIARLNTELDRMIEFVVTKCRETNRMREVIKREADRHAVGLTGLVVCRCEVCRMAREKGQ